MDEEYDAILLGTGIVECVISGLLSISGKKVLHIDRNDYYGGEVASLSIDKLFQKFGKTGAENFGRSNDWNIDLCLKLIMAHSDLVGMLVSTGVTKYIEFKLVEGSFVQRDKKIHKVPVTETDIAKSGLLGLMEKSRLLSMVKDCGKCDFDKDEVPKHFTKTSTMKQVYDKYGLDDNTRELVGHVISLHQTDDYLNRSCLETFKKIDNYNSSLQKYGKSPYLYPLYGLGELPQAFARLSAVYGGTYMLRTSVEGIVTDSNGKFEGIKSQGTVVKAKMVIGDPSYFTDRVKKVGSVVRCICILKHPVKAIGDAKSCQIILPSRQNKRKSDIYIGITSKVNESCPDSYYVAVITTNVESSNPADDIKGGLEYLGDVAEKILYVSDLFEPVDDGKGSNIFISKSYDATTHFDTATNDINDLWFRITGEKLTEDKLKGRIQEE